MRATLIFPTWRRATVATLLLGASAVALADCGERLAEARLAYRDDNAGRLDALLEQSGRCSAGQRRQLRAWAASLAWNRIVERSQSGESDAALQPELERVAALAPLWQPNAALGDLYAKTGRHAHATEAYQRALDAINDHEATSSAPPDEVIATLLKKAETQRMLSPTYVATTRSRGGEPGGLASASIRGFGVNRVALPIQFVKDSVRFTDKGQAAAADLLDYLRQQQPPNITLFGHTDPDGGDAYNLQLSLDRAKAVERFLRQQGYSGEIEVLGRGEREPFQVDAPNQYRKEQLYQLHRRVELVR